MFFGPTSYKLVYGRNFKTMLRYIFELVILQFELYCAFLNDLLLTK